MNGLEVFEQFKDENSELMQRIDLEVNPPCSPKQRGYIYGMCRKLGYDEHDLPYHISPINDPRNMSVGEAEEAINTLLDEVETMESAYFAKWGEKKRYGKKAGAEQAARNHER